jgi:hypothetical protein
VVRDRGTVGSQRIGGVVSGPGAGGLPPIRRRGVGNPSGPGAAGRTASGGARRGAVGPGVTGWDDVAGPPGSTRSRADGWGGPTIASVRLERPNALLIAGLAALSTSTAVLVLRGGRFELATAIVTGMFVGVVLLGLARLDANGKRSGGRFADWRVESVRVATILFVLGWAAGLVSLWRFALVISRNFT